MKLAFYKGEGDWTDKLIRWWTGSKYSHVEIVTDNWMWYSVSPRDTKVRATYIKYKEENWDLVDIGNVVALHAVYMETKGSKYDWLGILFSQVFAFNINSKKRWFCSEWCAEVLKRDGNSKIKAPSNFYSPGALYDAITKVCE